MVRRAQQAAPLQWRARRGAACCARRLGFPITAVVGCLGTQHAALITHQSPDFVVVGHLTCDRLAAGTMLGGAAAYAGLTAARLGRRVGIVTAAGPDVDLRPLAEIAIACRPSPLTTTFVNLYEGSRRRQRLEAVAVPIQPEDVPPTWLDAELAMLAPVAGEVPSEIAGRFRSRLVLAAPQGWLRRRDADDLVHPAPWADAGRVLPHVDAVVLAEEDLAGEPRVIEDLARSGRLEPPLVVVTRGAAGARVSVDGCWSDVPAFPARVVDPTGAGDVFAAAFLVRLGETGDAIAAARFAGAAASLAIEAIGLAGVAERAAVEQRLAGV